MTLKIILLTLGSFIGGLDPAWVALISTIVGGVILKVVEKWLAKNQNVRADRQDFRAEIKDLMERLDKVEAEVDTWRAKYYEAQEELHKLRKAMIDAGLDPYIAKPETPPQSL